MVKCWIITAFTFLFISCGAISAPNVRVDTSLGSFTIELDPDQAPVTVANFMKYVEDGSYRGSIFHRVIPNFIIQGGGFTSEMVRLRTYTPIMNESSNGLSNRIATVAMARPKAANSATRQFFINLANNDFLDQANRPPGYAVFGKIISGYSVIENMARQPTSTQGFMKDVPKTPIVITNVSLIPASTIPTSKTHSAPPPSSPDVPVLPTPVTAPQQVVVNKIPASPPGLTVAETQHLTDPTAPSKIKTAAVVTPTVKTMNEVKPVSAPTPTSANKASPVTAAKPSRLSKTVEAQLAAITPNDDLSSLLQVSKPTTSPISFTPHATLSNHNLVRDKTFKLISKDFRKSPYIAYSDDCSFDVRPIDAHQNVQNAIEKALSDQFKYQGFDITKNSQNTITIEIPKALVYVKNADFKNHMYANVIIAITAETPRGKLIKTYNGTAKRTAAFQASTADIEHVLNDISSKVLKKVAEDPELQDYMKERF